MYKLSRYLVISDYISSNARLLYATRAGKYVVIKDSVLDLLQAGRFDEIDLKTLIPLFERGVIVPEDADEFEDILRHNKNAIRDSQALGLIIQPTANCQLGCHYCGQVHAKRNMSGRVAEATVARITSKLALKNTRH